MIKYNEAEIYLTRCSHPDFKDLKYLGLDTKRDPDYLGSSVVLKWWINFIGRSYFYKEIIDTVTGGMDGCCRLEQEYLVDYNAIKDPNFLNMNGGTPKVSRDDKQIDMEFLIRPVSTSANDLISMISNEVLSAISFFDQSRNQMISRVISLVVYGHLKYTQEDFEYNKYCSYGSCTSEDTQAVLNCLERLGYIDTTYELITITPKLVESIPLDLDHSDFVSTLREN